MKVALHARLKTLALPPPPIRFVYDCIFGCRVNDMFFSLGLSRVTFIYTILCCICRLHLDVGLVHVGNSNLARVFIRLSLKSKFNQRVL